MTKDSIERIVLVATKNKDKFLLVRDMFRYMIDGDVVYCSLLDVSIVEDFIEYGSTVEERAINKAKNYTSVVGSYNISNRILCVVGVDDGIYIHETKSDSVDLKYMSMDIMDGKILKPGDYIDVLRGFAVLFPRSDCLMSCTTRIPFVYVERKNPVPLLHNSYPLSHVFAIPGTSVAVANNRSIDNTKYYVKCSYEDLSPITAVISNEIVRRPG